MFAVTTIFSLGLCAAILSLLYLIAVIILLLNLVFNVSVPDLTGKHVVVTGGSSGIGKSVGVEAVRRGANVTIIARDTAKLEVAITELNACKITDSQKITLLSLDVTQKYSLTNDALNQLENTVAPIDIFVNCAGTCVCGTIENDSEENFRKMLELNLLGTMLPTKAVAKRMISREKGGIIVITASVGALLGIYGMGAYCASKWGLRGFAESLHQELSHHNISVTLCLPPDTDTPGYEEENRGKPEETKLICQGGGLVSPDEVAKKLLSDAMRGRFWSTTGLEGTLISIGCAGFSPLSSTAEVALQIMLTSLVRIVAVFHLRNVKSIIEKLSLSRKRASVQKKNE